MLSSLRRYTRCLPRFIQGRIAPFSSTPLHQAQKRPLNNTDELLSIIEKAGDDADTDADEAPVAPGPSELLTQETHYKQFLSNMILRPHDMDMEYRKLKRAKQARPQLIGPSRKEARGKDIFYQLGIDPLSQATNPHLLNNYISRMGKIQGRNLTCLTMQSQRRLAKAIRRARMMGVIPMMSRRNILRPADKMNARDTVGAKVQRGKQLNEVLLGSD